LCFGNQFVDFFLDNMSMLNILVQEETLGELDWLKWCEYSIIDECADRAT
jgi:hypothetical protein